MCEGGGEGHPSAPRETNHTYVGDGARGISESLLNCPADINLCFNFHRSEDLILWVDLYPLQRHVTYARVGTRNRVHRDLSEGLVGLAIPFLHLTGDSGVSIGGATTSLWYFSSCALNDILAEWAGEDRLVFSGAR